MTEYKSYEERIKAKEENISLLVKNLNASKDKLSELLEKANNHWTYEDAIYRFYHYSFKAYYIQETTKNIVNELKNLLPDVELNKMFLQIVEEGTNKKFILEHNKEWLLHVRPLVEAFFHAKYFLEMAVRYSHYQQCPNILPSGFASILYLYNLR